MPQFPLIKMFCSLWNVSSASQSRVFTRQKRVRNKLIIYKKEKKKKRRRAVFCLLFMFARCRYKLFSCHVWFAVVIIDVKDVVVVTVVTVDGFVCLLLFFFSLMAITVILGYCAALIVIQSEGRRKLLWLFILLLLFTIIFLINNNESIIIIKLSILSVETVLNAFSSSFWDNPVGMTDR